MSFFIPGPWEYSNGEIFSAACTPIAKVHPHTSHWIARDNGLLITAAPELLEALEWALGQIDDDLDPDHQAALKQARTLLKRIHA